MGLLARRDYSRQELRDKLLQKFSRQVNHQRLPFGRVPKTGSSSAAQPESHREALDAFEGIASPDQSSATAVDLEALIQAELDQLQQDNLQSDQRFVESFINGRKSRGDGPFKIRQALRLRGVSDLLVERLLNESDDEWFELASRVYRKKFGGDKKPGDRDYTEKARRQRFMQQRGFPGWMLEELF